MDLTRTFFRRGPKFVVYYTGNETLIHEYTIQALMKKQIKLETFLPEKTYFEEDLLFVFGKLSSLPPEWKGTTIGFQLEIPSTVSIDLLSRFDYLLVEDRDQVRRLQMIIGTIRVFWVPSFIFLERPKSNLVVRKINKIKKHSYKTVEELFNLVNNSSLVITTNRLEDLSAAALGRPFISTNGSQIANELEIDKFYTELEEKKMAGCVSFLRNISSKYREYLETFDWSIFLSTFYKRKKRIGSSDLVRYIELVLCQYKEIKTNELIADLICSRFTGVSGSQYTEHVVKIMSTETSFLTEKIVRYLLKQDRNIPLFNLGTRGVSDFCGMHRWGWEGVLNLLKPYSGEGGLYLDSYIDRTFHWSKNTLFELGILPYRFPWIGFIHHTFNKCVEANSENLFKDNLFRISLQTCAGLFCLTKTLQNECLAKLDKMKLNVPVYFLYHPSETDVTPFNIELLENITSVPIVQIGAWYRNTFSIYILDVENQRLGLKNLKMGGYYPPKNFSFTRNDVELGSKIPWLDYLFEYIREENFLVDILGYQVPKNFIVTIDRTLTQEVVSYETALQKWILDRIDQVNIVNRLTNEEYDNLLSTSIIFIDFKDVAASNSIVECIIRKTPLLVPKLDAIVEYLGEDYPLYFSDIRQIKKILQKDILIQTVKYLESRQKILQTSFFLKEFQKILAGLK